MHEKVLNLILANQTPFGPARTDDIRWFHIEGSTNTHIVARLISGRGEFPIQYEILFYKLDYPAYEGEMRREVREFLETL